MMPGALVPNLNSVRKYYYLVLFGENQILGPRNDVTEAMLMVFKAQVLCRAVGEEYPDMAKRTLMCNPTVLPTPVP